MSQTMVNWLSHSVGMLLVLVFSLPSFAIIWLAKKVAIHKELKPEQVKKLEWVDGAGGTELPANELPIFVAEFNEDIFIQRAQADEIARGPHLLVTTEQESIRLYPKSPGDLYVERIKPNGKTTVYWVRSEALSRRLEQASQAVG